MGFVFVPMGLLPEEMLEHVVELTDKQKAELWKELMHDDKKDEDDTK